MNKTIIFCCANFRSRKIEEIKDALVSRENQNTLINITEI